MLFLFPLMGSAPDWIRTSNQSYLNTGSRPAACTVLLQGLLYQNNYDNCLQDRLAIFEANLCPSWDSNPYWQRPQRCSSAVGIDGLKMLCQRIELC